ncbi:MAG: hypothetical protein K8E24_015705 [Methanobacterium paludis]|nr:hypothetical protein [Methanobacterium paludis]
MALHADECAANSAYNLGENLVNRIEHFNYNKVGDVENTFNFVKQLY